MGQYRVTSVNYLSVVTTLVEHADIKAKYAGQIYSTAHASLIRAYYHHMIRINLEAAHIAQECFYKLISCTNCFKTIERNSVLNTRIMCIKGDDVIYTH